MKRDRVKKLLRHAVPFVALALIFGFVLACGGEPSTKEVSKAEEKVAVNEEETKGETEEGLLTLGQSIEYKGLRVSVTDYKFTDTWEDVFYGTQEPKEGDKFIWIYVRVENIGDDLIVLPLCADFDVKSIYGKYKGKSLLCDSSIGKGIADEPNYIAFDGISRKKVRPGYGSEGWIIYLVSEKAKSEDIKIYFLGYGGSYETECIWKLEK